MKYLPLTTILLWLSIVFGFLYAREFILQPIVKFPLFILLAIFLPVCFWVLASNNRRIYAYVFIAIFTFNTGILAYAVFSSYSFFKSFDPYKETRIDPQVAELLITGESEEIRNVAGQVIFEKHGVSLPYMTETDHFRLFAPTKANKYKFQRNSAENARLSFLKYNTIYQFDSLLFLLILQVSLFIGLLCFLVLHDPPTRHR